MAAKEKVIEASVVVPKPREEVFGFYRDFRNLPRFRGDVVAVEQSIRQLLGGQYKALSVFG